MRKIIAIFCCITLMFIFASCVRSDNGKEVALAVIGGQHDNLVEYKEANGKDILENNDDFWKSNYHIVELFGVVNDGKPEKTYLEDAENDGDNKKYNFEDFQKFKGYPDWDVLRYQAKDFINRLSLEPADDSEFDTLKSFKVVSEYFKEYTADVDKRIIVFDSGLSTTGDLDFTNYNIRDFLFNENDKEMDLLIDRLYEVCEIPNLSGAKILWYGFGLAGDEKGQSERIQDELSNIQIKRLKTLWEKVLEKAGVKSGDIKFYEHFDGKTTTKCENLPSVSSVELVKPLTDEVLGFKDNSSEFREGTATERKKIIKEYAELGKATKLLLVGTTSSNNEKGKGVGLILSAERVEVVKSLLLEKGVNDNDIECIALGIYSHAYNKDEFVNGVYDGNSEAAKRNRSVYIMDAESYTADRFRRDKTKYDSETFLT